MERTFGWTRVNTTGAAAPGATVTVYNAGTLVLATIYSDELSTPKANPFISSTNAESAGYWFFYAATGDYDVRVSGTGVTTPYTMGDISSGFMQGIPSSTYAGLPSASASTGFIYRVTDTIRGLWYSTGTQWVQIGGNTANAKDFGAIGDGTADDTAALAACYAAAKAWNNPVGTPPNGTRGTRMFIPAGSYRITSSLTWNGPVSIDGAGGGSNPYNGTTILKDGNFVGVKVLTANTGDETNIGNFTINTLGGLDASDHLEIDTAGVGQCNFHNIMVRGLIGVTRYGRDGIIVRSLNNSSFTNILTVGMARDGIRVHSLSGTDPTASANTLTWVNIDTRGNGGAGFNIVAGQSHTGLGITTQENVGKGFMSNDIRNIFKGVYAEGNTDTDIWLGATSQTNFIEVTNAAGISDVVDLCTDNSNVIFDMANGLYYFGNLRGSRRSTNDTGRDITIVGGAAGAGGVAKEGGDVVIAGGDKNGAADDGVVRFQVGKANAICLPNLTTAQMNAIVAPENSMIIYNTTTAKVTAYAGGAWVALH